VEASTLGSIILASVLLKMGGLGGWYTIKYLKFMMNISWMIVGILIRIVLILFVRDLKIMVAYSSVAHMTLVFYCIMLGFDLGVKGRLLIMFYHGIISSLIFWLVGILGVLKSRRIFMTKYIELNIYYLLVIFVILVLNISFPPFIGFLSEVLMLKRLLKISLLLIFFCFSKSIDFLLL